MSALLSVSKAIDVLNQRIGVAVYWLVLLMSLVSAYNAIVRWLGGIFKLTLASNAYLELQWYLFSMVFLLGAGYTLKHNGHVRIDVFFGKLKPRTQAWIDILGTLIFLLPFVGFVFFASLEFVRESWGEMSPDPGGLPRYPIRAVIPVAMALLFLQGVSELIKRIAFLSGRAEYKLQAEHAEEVV